MGHTYVDTMINTRYACFAHPRLSPDSWHQLDSSKPVDAGAQAALVCRFGCPAGIAGECPVTSGTEVISGYGWFNRQSRLHPFVDNEIEAHQAAAYVGLTERAFVHLARYHRIPVIRKEKHLRFYALDAVKKAARTSGPNCGTIGKLMLHEIRGDAPCLRCHGV
jgi:hypothetical protein